MDDATQQHDDTARQPDVQTTAHHLKLKMNNDSTSLRLSLEQRRKMIINTVIS